MKLSVLDFDATLSRASSLAPAAESLGYTRYWFGEHVPQPNAELLVALVAGLTSTLRIGTGGIALRMRNVVQCATNFLFLASMYPGRIDAGVHGALSRPESPVDSVPAANASDFGTQVRALLNVFSGEGSRAALISTLRARVEVLPETWILGTGAASAALAGELGQPYAYSLFHPRAESALDPIALYRRSFTANSDRERPYTILAVAGVCATTDDLAHHRMTATRQFGEYPDVGSPLVGSVASCTAKLRQLVERYNPDEVMLLELSNRVSDAIVSLSLFMEVAHALS